MSGIFDQIINYSPPLIVSGTVNYKGTWNASTNNPTLNDPPAASTKGDYYVVSTAGTQFSITFGVGDWIISNGTAWEKVDLTDAVSSVFGRTGAVVGDSTDYSAVGITNTAIGASSPSTGAFTSLSSSSTTTLNGTTIPASKTLVVTTDKLSALAATTSAELAGVISDETGSGALVFANSPTLVTPALGTPSSGTVTNLTGTASININGTVGATTPSTVAATTITASGQATLSTTLLVGSGATLTGSGVEVQASNFQIIGRSSSTTRMMLAHDGTKGKIGTLDNQSFDFLVNNAIVGTVSSTGLAVTGALSASGNVDIGSSGGSRSISIYGSDTSNAITGTLGIRIVNSNAGATGRLTPIAFGGRGLANSPFAAIAGCLTADTAFEQAGTLRFYAKGTATSGDPSLVMEMASTGLAVTGALSATGRVSTLAGTNVTLTNARNDDVAIGTAGFFRFLGGGASAQISGMAAGTDGQQITVFNATGSNIVFLYDDANSTAANRIYVDGGVSITLANAGAIAFIYLAVSSRWVFVGKP